MRIKDLPENAKHKLIRIGFHLEASIDENYEGVGGALCGFYIITPLAYAAKVGDFGLARLLIENGADLNARDGTHGLTPLMWASWYGRHRIVKYLLDLGADESLTVTNTNSPLEGRNAYDFTRYSSCSFASFWYNTQKCMRTGDIHKTRVLLETQVKL